MLVSLHIHKTGVTIYCSGRSGCFGRRTSVVGCSNLQ